MTIKNAMKKFAMTASLSLLIGLSAAAQTTQPTPYENAESNKTGSLALNNRGAGTPATQTAIEASAASQSQTEPLLLLLFGLAVFVGATTVKHKKSGGHRETQS
ncbi:MAG: hypothetical protein SF339_14825 [Blastocatellia bacterium]|nr:hypothetical protein [Blastocatellia bacterium]